VIKDASRDLGCLSCHFLISLLIPMCQILFSIQSNHRVSSGTFPNALVSIQSPSKPPKQYIIPYSFLLSTSLPIHKTKQTKIHNNHQRHKHATHQASRHNIYLLSAIIFHLTPLPVEIQSSGRKLRDLLPETPWAGDVAGKRAMRSGGGREDSEEEKENGERCGF
jgi:hypothetical protein